MYHFLKLLITLGIRVFFRSVKWADIKNFPNDKSPLLLVANHPGTFMDPLVIASGITRPLFFLAKAEVFKSAVAKWLLPKFNMIPVYRKQDDESLMHKNEETFEKCFDHLSAKGAILIFPEGISITERKLRKIKTGAARIAIGAESRNNFELGIKIIPIGINYSHEIKFQSNLFVKVGEVIEVKNYKELYVKDKFEAAEKLTEEIRARLEKLIIAVKDDETENLVKRIELIFKNKILAETGASPYAAEQDFDVTQKIARAVEYYNDKDPQRITKIKDEVERYFSALDRLKISDRWIENFSEGGSLLFKTLLTIIYMVAGFPVYVFGVVNNYLPYKIPYVISRKVSSRPEFWGAISMASGILTFIGFYFTQIYFVGRFFENSYLIILYSLLLPVSGFFAYKYWKRFINVKGRLFIATLFMKRSTLIASLITQRATIIKDLQKGREEFNAVSEVI